MAVEDMSDDNYVMVRLVDNRKEDHFILGHVTKARYYKKHGDVFLMHKDDIAAQPHIYEMAVRAEMVIPQVTMPAPIPEPVAVVERESPDDYAKRVQGEWPDIFTDNELEHDALVAEKSFDLQLIPGITSNIAQQLESNGVNSLELLAKWDTEKLMAIKGVGESRAEQIQEYVREQLK